MKKSAMTLAMFAGLCAMPILSHADGGGESTDPGAGESSGGSYAVVDEENSSGFAKNTYGPYTTYTFAADGEITFSQAGKADVLLVGGGGGGGMTMGGGGGGGGVRELADQEFPAEESISVVVGKGGAGGPAENVNCDNGGNSHDDCTTR